MELKNNLTKDVLLEYIRKLKNPIETPILRKHLHNENYAFTKKTLNKMLYELWGQVLISKNNNIPPAWLFVDNSNKYPCKIIKVNNPITYVMIDCDNKPRCFKNACKVANKNQIVYGFANAQYNYYRPHFVTDYYCVFLQSKLLLKDVAKIEMCGRIFQICERRKRNEKIYFILVSGDKAMGTIAVAIKQYYINVEIRIVTLGWDELKLEIE